MVIYQQIKKRVLIVQSPNKSLTKGLQVLKEIMLENRPITANVLCQRLHIDKSTMSRLITALMNEHFIEYVEHTKEIILSDLMRKITKKDDREKLVQKSEALLDDIFHLCNECSYLGILDENSVLFLNQVDKSNRVLQTRNSVGFHTPLHTNAFGKIVVAFSEDFNINKVDLKKFTNNTITSITKFQKEIDLIRQRGYAIGNEEHEFGLCSVAVGYFNNKNEFLGTLGVSGLSVRFDEEKLHDLGKKIFRLVNPSF